MRTADLLAILGIAAIAAAVLFVDFAFLGVPTEPTKPVIKHAMPKLKPRPKAKVKQPPKPAAAKKKAPKAPINIAKKPAPKPPTPPKVAKKPTPKQPVKPVVAKAPARKTAQNPPAPPSLPGMITAPEDKAGYATLGGKDSTSKPNPAPAKSMKNIAPKPLAKAPAPAKAKVTKAKAPKPAPFIPLPPTTRPASGKTVRVAALPHPKAPKVTVPAIKSTPKSAPAKATAKPASSPATTTMKTATARPTPTLNSTTPLRSSVPANVTGTVNDEHHTSGFGHAAASNAALSGKDNEFTLVNAEDEARTFKVILKDGNATELLLKPGEKRSIAGSGIVQVKGSNETASLMPMAVLYLSKDKLTFIQPGSSGY